MMTNDSYLTNFEWDRCWIIAVSIDDDDDGDFDDDNDDLETKN